MLHHRVTWMLLSWVSVCSAHVHAQEPDASQAPPPSAAPSTPDAQLPTEATESSAPTVTTTTTAPEATPTETPTTAPEPESTPTPVEAPAPAEAPADKSKRPATMDEVAESSEQELHFGRVKARYVFNFFGNVLATVREPGGGDQSPAFAIGLQDFVLRGELGNQISATTEFTIEIDDQINDTVVSLERLQARWQNEHFFIDAGRSHTNIGYWNAAYHHGSWLQPSIKKPGWVRGEHGGGILPVHWVGLTVGANTKIGDGSLRGALAVGNNRGKVTADIRNEYDYQPNKALYGSIEYAGLGLHDLRIGLSGVYSRIPAQGADVRPALPDESIDEVIGGFHIAYPSLPVMFIMEGYAIEHWALGHDWLTYGGFVLAGYTLGDFMPYAEVGRILSSGGMDPFFIPDSMPANGNTSLESIELVGGLRWDVSSWSALRLEYQYVDSPDALEKHAIVLDWSWGF